jgi:molecular chaperone GrpE
MAINAHKNEKGAAVLTGSGESRHLLRPADLAGEIEGLREDLRQERDRHLRVLADFKNYRRHVEREGNRLADAGKREMLLPLIGIIDDLEKALQWAGGSEGSMTEGLQSIHQKLVALLETQEVRSFDSQGRAFTPDLHEAVALAKSSEVEQGTVVEDLRRGYLWRSELLRPAQVRVAG